MTMNCAAHVPHRIEGLSATDAQQGTVRYAPVKSVWFLSMAVGALVGGAYTASWPAVGVFVITTATVLLFGHSLGNHRKLVHDSFQCPSWLEYLLVYLGVQVGLAGPLGLLRQHDLRDHAQRLPDCHPYLRHGQPAWRDAWWQLHCELTLHRPPTMVIEPRIASNRFYRFLERTWMAQQIPGALLLYAAGGWAFVWWGVCARVTAGVFGHWLIGYLAHNHGELHLEVRGAAVQGRNVRLTSLLTMGECWHNNHHAYPGSARLGLRAGEWDPGWWVLMGLRRVRLVWAIRLPADLRARPEVVACVAEPMGGAPGDRILKVNHAGEVGAAAIYRGQRLACRFRDAALRRDLDEFRRHEEQHRALFLAELNRRGLRPCRSAWICGAGGLLLGLATGVCGRRAIAVTTVAVEHVVLRHLAGQLRDLRRSDAGACRVIRAIMDDERAHHALGLRGLPPSDRATPLGALISAVTESVIWLGMHV